MKILNLSYQPVPNLHEHEMLHRSVNNLGTTGWTGLIQEAKDFNPDLIIEREWNDSKALYQPLLKAFPEVPKVWWWIDAHVLYEYRKAYARNFDFLFLAVSKYAEAASEDLGIPAWWLPLSCPWEADGCFERPEPKEYTLSFIARITPPVYFERRIRFIQTLREHFGSMFYFETTPAMTSIVRRSQISLNCAYKDDLNFRVFEVLGCGTELITDAVPDLYKVPGLEERVNVYHSFDDLIPLVEAVMRGEHRHNMQEVQRWVRDNHCIEHRYRRIIEELQYAKALPN